MLIDKEVLIKWNPSNREHYMNKGFPFTKWHDEISVPIEMASPSCIHEIRVVCDYCCEEYIEIVYRFKNRYKDIIIEKHACEKCFKVLQNENKLYKKVELHKGRIGENEFTVIINHETIKFKKCKVCNMYKEIDCFRSNEISVANQCTECDKIYAEDNKYLIKLRHIKERSSKKDMANTLTLEELLEIYKTFDEKCALTGSLNVHCEHFIPLNWGHGGTYFGNIYLLDGSLNAKKNNKNPFKWIKGVKGFDKKKWNELIKYLAKCNKLTINEFKNFVFWCEQNKRNENQIKKDGNVSSIELWKRSIGKL